MKFDKKSYFKIGLGILCLYLCIHYLPNVQSGIRAFAGALLPLIIGGVEASLRRFAHYDYWDDKVRRSMLFDARADILIYGMGERQIVEIADKINLNVDSEDVE